MDRAQAHAQQFVEDALARRERAHAGHGLVGSDRCVDCDEPIAVARRQALPTADRCTECQIAHERRTGR